MSTPLVPAFISLEMAFGLQLRGGAGALALSVTALVIDYLWFRFRVQRAHRGGTSHRLFLIIGVLLMRLLTLIAFLTIGGWWLEPAARPVFYWALLTIPFWNLLGAVKLSNHP